MGDVYYTYTKARKDENNYVKVGPKQFGTRKMTKGKGDDALFSKPGYLALGKLALEKLTFR